MLAAVSARAILCAEHERIRELLTQVDEAVQAGGLAVGPQARALAMLVERLQTFDEATHRPKGAVLLSTLRGRSAETDALLQRLTTTRERCDSLLSQVCSRLQAAEDGELEAAAGVEVLLKEHRALTLAHLDAEDSLLHSLAAAHLTRDEWAAVASEISKSVTPTKY